MCVVSRFQTMQEDKNYSDYVIYVDESGDHGLKSIDPQYPVFALVFCIFEKKYFCNHVVPSFKELKFKYWGGRWGIFGRDHRLRAALVDGSWPA